MISLNKIPTPAKSKSFKFPDLRGHLIVNLEIDDLISNSLSIKTSFSKKNVFRGLHYQPENVAQTKYIRVLSGKILDFVYDMKKNDGQIKYFELGPSDGYIKIDSFLAHGFYALEDVEFTYICIGPYSKQQEKTISILNMLSKIGINNPILSEYDKIGLPLESHFGK